MGAFLIRLLVNAAALWVAAQVIPGITLQGPDAIVLAALIFGLVNALIRPIVLAATCLITMATLGLFTFIVNALMLLLTSWLAGKIPMEGTFQVDGFWPALLGSIVISIVSFVLTRFIRE